MSKLITIDPVTRIEGHLRIDVEVDGGAVKNAWSSGTMWRGIETILQGRDPRDAWIFTQRICGVCTTVHAIASVRSVENALGLEIPLNAQLIRNLIVTAHTLHDHIVHFYQLSALDWVDVTSALKADPVKAAQLAESISSWPGNSKHELAAVKARLEGFVKAGQMGIFTNGYWGHPAMKLSPEVNLLAVAHYLQALEIQRKANMAVAILGSKTPNIQNLAVGGVANAINLDSPAALNMEKLYQVKTLIDEVATFVQQCYLPDVAAIGGFYPDWFKYGAGVTNYLSVPELPLDEKMSKFDIPGGVLWNGKLELAHKLAGWNDDYLKQNVTESIAHAHYDGAWAKGPWEEDDKPKFAGEWKHETPAPDRYTWVKAPRLEGKPVQVGPLACVLVGLASGHEPTTRWATAAIGAVKAIHKIDLTPAHLHSTLGRHAARAIRAAMMAEMAQKQWKLLVENIGKGDTRIWVDPMANLKPGIYKGVGFHEAPRGTLSHWCVIEADKKGMKLKNYQCVVPSTWNAGPRDASGTLGPYEKSLVGNPIADPKLPLEALRTIHSFDPCLACAIHTVDAEGDEIARVKVL
ncbi:nickel-dependent hydrogenase large subunit [Anaeromyxobacter dehalogenans]|uniref:Nickel-dependent hydrogenase, large subunit n=1 Tax=Anaeromyxobacter dehalogenans (strain 2CP-C) TaxID=290397 RepID=Q2IN69_ANADE|nr:nickel-dependent hydrogenase large subunit [Anaeromyxobacter dehalogenans]ABC80254.1 Nickel-dependent hydrogenase, large subunit [Anaeromyxobacter dehalogenans 2CP-C]